MSLLSYFKVKVIVLQMANQVFHELALPSPSPYFSLWPCPLLSPMFILLQPTLAFLPFLEQIRHCSHIKFFVLVHMPGTSPSLTEFASFHSFVSFIKFHFLSETFLGNPSQLQCFSSFALYSFFPNFACYHSSYDRQYAFLSPPCVVSTHRKEM